MNFHSNVVHSYFLLKASLPKKYSIAAAVNELHLQSPKGTLCVRIQKWNVLYMYTVLISHSSDVVLTIH